MPGKRPPSFETEVAKLYSLPLEEWTAARNALAKGLRGEGRKDEAQAVQALRKPTLSAWAVNQLFKREGERMKSLLDAGRRARAAQGQAVAGKGAEAFREALGAARRLALELRRRAVDLLSEGGKIVGGEVGERIGRDLEALAFSPAAATEAARGYLDADLDPPGFEVLAGLTLVGRPPSPPEPSPVSPRRGTASVQENAEEQRLLTFKKPPGENRAEAAARRREEAATARRAQEEARRRERVAKAEASVEAATEKAATLGEEAEVALRAAEAARQRAQEAERAAAVVERRAAAAKEDLDRARERLAAERSAADGD
jgi:hypothetical protein